MFLRSAFIQSEIGGRKTHLEPISFRSKIEVTCIQSTDDDDYLQQYSGIDKAIVKLTRLTALEIEKWTSKNVETLIDNATNGCKEKNVETSTESIKCESKIYVTRAKKRLKFKTPI